MKLEGLDEKEWTELARRVSTGTATTADAERVERLGLDLQAKRIEHGLATHSDGVLINLEAQLQLLGERGLA